MRAFVLGCDSERLRLDGLADAWCVMDLPPEGYLETVGLTSAAAVIVADSGAS